MLIINDVHFPMCCISGGTPNSMHHYEHDKLCVVHYQPTFVASHFVLQWVATYPEQTISYFVLYFFAAPVVQNRKKHRIFPAVTNARLGKFGVKPRFQSADID